MRDIAGQIAQQVVGSRIADHTLSLVRIIEWEVGWARHYWITSSGQGLILGSNSGDSYIVDNEDIVADSKGADIADDVRSIATSDEVDVVCARRARGAVSAIVDGSCTRTWIDWCWILCREGC